MQHAAAPRALVYRLLLDADAVVQWKVPDGMTAEVHRFEPKEGGRVHLSLTYMDTSVPGKTVAHTDSYQGYFMQLVPDELVVECDVFESADPAFGGEMISRIILHETADGGTDIVGVHEGVPVGVRLEDNVRGWEMALGKLARLAEDSDRRERARD